jgi:arylsulfatase A-like enzyme
VAGKCAAGPTCTAGTNGKLPNVVMIVSDDLDQASLDLLLANGKLPNIQNYIINHGTRFTQSYVGNALCGPSRATFLTGQYSHNNLVNTNANCMGKFAPHAASTIGTAMKTAGYRTGYFGKYLNGYGPNTYHAPGWDEWQVMTDATVYWLWGFTLVKYITPAATTTLVQYGGGSTARSATNYQTDVLASLGSTFINTWADTSGTKPFFLVEMPLAPHVEVLPGQSFNSYTLELQLRTRPASKYYGTLRKTLSGGGVDDYTPISPAFELPKFSAPSFNETDITDKPSWVSAWPVMDATNINYTRRQYLDRLEAILSVDDMVGTIYAALTAKGVVDNTLVLLTGDNGFMLGEHRLNNKMFPYEESIRVPLIASCGAPSGVVEDRFVSNIDLAPTIADYGKAVTLANADGRSFRGILERASVPSWRSRVMVEHWFEPAGAQFNDCPDHALVRTSSSEATPNHKYVEYYGTSGTINQSSVPNDFEQYDLPADPYEVQSVSKNASYAPQRAALAPELKALRLCAAATCRSSD